MSSNQKVQSTIPISLSESPGSRSDPIHIVIHKPDSEYELQNKIDLLEKEIGRLLDLNRQLENLYGYESRLNNELIDILREHKIPFRPALESAKSR